MHVIRHNDNYVKINCPPMIVQAMLQNETARRGRKIPTLRGAEGYEQDSIVALVVRKVTAILVMAKFCGEHGIDLTES